MASLRLAVKSLRTMVAHQYYFIVCLHDAQLQPGKSRAQAQNLDAKLSGTSDVSELTTNPEFKNKTFYFSINSSESVTPERYLKESSITCQLFATDVSSTPSTSYGADGSERGPKGKDVKPYTDQLIQSSTHVLTSEEVAALLGKSKVDISFKFDDVAVMHADLTCIPTDTILNNDTCRLFLEDLYDHQRVLSNVQEQSRHNGEDSDRMKAQCSGLTYQNRLLQDEVAEMRQILDDERRAAKAAPQLEGWQEMSLEELYKRAEQSISLYRKEQTRNTELMHQLKRMHGRSIEHENSMRRFHELQEAHALQSKQIGQFEKENARVEQYKSTCKTQEKIISRLERMLQANLGFKEKLAKTEEKLREKVEECERIKDEAKHNELEVARAEVMTLHGSKTENETKLVEAQKMQLAMTMRAEKAEVRAMAARNELIEASKRFAHEISTLKARLAEKDAQLLGGFGPLANNFSTTTNASRFVPTPASSQPNVQGLHSLDLGSESHRTSPANRSALSPSPQGFDISEALGKEESIQSQISKNESGKAGIEAGKLSPAATSEEPSGSPKQSERRNSPSPTTTLDPAAAEQTVI